MTTRYLISGGAGFLGVNLIRYLLQVGSQVVSLDIAAFNYTDIKDRVRVVQGDIRDKRVVDSSMDGVDVVVHCAAALPSYPPEEIYSTDIDGTRNILTSALEHGVKRVVHISSTGVYGAPDKNPQLEDDDLVSIGPYGKAKVCAEEICQEFRERGLSVPVLRPKTFVGPERLGIWAILYEWAYEGRNFPILGRGDNRYQLLDVEDLCEAIFLCATSGEERVNDVFNIGAKGYRTMKEDFQAVLDHAGFGKKIRSFPALPMIVVLRLLEWLRLSPLYRWVYETAWKDSYVSIEKAERVLGFTPRYSNQEALIRNFEWYLNHLDQFQNSSGVSHRTPWKQGILVLAKHFF